MSERTERTKNMSEGFELDGVGIVLGRTRVVDGLDLSVRQGEILAVLGKSGCGKSTLLRALAGLLPVDTGTIDFGGRPITGPSRERGLVFQEDATLPWHTVARNVDLPLRIAGVPRAERRTRVGEIIERVGLGRYERALPKQLSGGMRQRVQLARTLVAAPQAVLMDEPFGALDAQTRRSMQRLLIDVWSARPTTVVFVTHDVDEAMLVADRIAVLSTRPARLRRLVEIPRPRTPRWLAETAARAVREELLDEVHETTDDRDLDEVA